MNARSTSELQKRQSIQLESPFLSSRLNHRLNQLDRATTRLMARYGLRLLSIGIGFLGGKAKHVVLLLQMAAAMSPLILAPERLWEAFPFVWTLKGQYVFKDIVLMGAGLVIGATNRGGGLSAGQSIDL